MDAPQTANGNWVWAIGYEEILFPKTFRFLPYTACPFLIQGLEDLRGTLNFEGIWTMMAHF